MLFVESVRNAIPEYSPPTMSEVGKGSNSSNSGSDVNWALPSFVPMQFNPMLHVITDTKENEEVTARGKKLTFRII